MIRPPLDHINPAWRMVDQFHPAWLLVDVKPKSSRTNSRLRAVGREISLLAAIYCGLWLARAVLRILFS